MEIFRFVGGYRTRSPFATQFPEIKGLPLLRDSVDGTAVKVPFIPASAQKGVLRRYATDALARVFMSANLQMTLQDYLLATSGGIKGSAKTSGTVAEQPLVRRRLIERAPLLALHGAGESPVGFVASGLAIQDARAGSGAVDKIRGTRVAEHKSSRFAAFTVARVLSEEEAKKAVAIADATAIKSALNKEIDDLKKQRRKADEQQKAMMDTEIARKTEERDEIEKMMRDVGGSDNSIGLPLPERDLIPAGTSLRGGMTLSTPNRHALGLHLASLRLWADNPRFGAMESKGYGFVDADWRVMSGDKEIGRPISWREAGRIQVIDGHFSLSGEDLIQREASWAEGLELELQRASVPIATLEKLGQAGIANPA